MSYNRISDKLGNNQFTIIYTDTDRGNLNVEECIEKGLYFTIKFDEDLIDINSDYMVIRINELIKDALLDNPDIGKGSVYLPYLATTTNGNYVYFTSFNYYAGRGNNDIFYPRIFDKDNRGAVDVNRSILFKVATRADITKSNSAITEAMIGMNRVFGIPDNYDTVPFGYDFNDPHSVVKDDRKNLSTVFQDYPGDDIFSPAEKLSMQYVARGVSRFPMPLDKVGTKYIKVMTNLGCMCVDPITKDDRNIITVIPVTEPFNSNSSSRDMTSELHSQTFTTLSQTQIETIELYLRDENDMPLSPNADWMAELLVVQEEPEKLDVYRGTGGYVEPALNLSAGDPGSYQKLNKEIQKEHWNTMYLESEARNDQAYKIRRLI